MSSRRKHVTVLWTGGWDSTFRLADLVHRGPVGLTIRPVYIRDEARRSTPYELAAMEKISEQVHAVASRRGITMQVVETVNLDSLLVPQQVSEAYAELRRRVHMGGQYEWLAALTTYLDIDELELCIHRDDKAYRCVSTNLLSRRGITDYPEEVLGEHAPENMQAVFGAYIFPIGGLSKLDMRRRAKSDGYLELLQSTWFCYAPTAKGQPCGRCQPCAYTIEEGLGDRMPIASRVRYLLSVKRLTKKVLNRWPRLWWWIERRRRDRHQI